MSRLACFVVCVVALAALASAAPAPCFVIAGLSSSQYVFAGDFAAGDGFFTQPFRNALFDQTNFGPSGTSQAQFIFLSIDDLSPATLAGVDLLILNAWDLCDDLAGPVGDGSAERNNRASRLVPGCDYSPLDSVRDAVDNGMILWLAPTSLTDDVLEYLGIPFPIFSDIGFLSFTTASPNVFQSGPFGNAPGRLEGTFNWDVNDLIGFPGIQPLYLTFGEGGAFTPAFLFFPGNGVVFVDGTFPFSFGPFNDLQRSVDEPFYPPSPSASDAAVLGLNAVDFFVSGVCSASISISQAGGTCPDKIINLDAQATCVGEWSGPPAVVFDDVTASVTTATITETGTFEIAFTACNGLIFRTSVTHLEPVVARRASACLVAQSQGTGFTLGDVLQVFCSNLIGKVTVSGLPGTTTASLTDVLSDAIADPRSPLTLDITNTAPGTFDIEGDINDFVLANVIFTLDGSIKGSTLPSKKIFYSATVFDTNGDPLKSFPRVSLTLCAEGDFVRSLGWGCFCTHY